MTVTRPVLRWHGGKFLLAPWIIEHFPAHRVYVEPFGGAASVLLRKPRAYAEIYNDLDGTVVNLFRVLRDPGAAEQLISALRLTPFSRAEFDLAFQLVDDPVEAARRLVIRSFMGFGSNAQRRTRNGFRANCNRSGTPPASDWANYPEALSATVARFARVVIENRPALEVMAQQDSAETLFYVDPPYLPETRDAGGDYAFELTPDDHLELLAALAKLKGMVVLSGYPSPVYDAALPGWRRVERGALADGARERVEVLWLNPAVVAALEAQARGDLFAGAAA